MKIKTIDYILPAYLAGYLINGDIESIQDSELNEIDDFMAKNKLLSCVSVSDYADFRRNNDLNNIGDDCLTYTFII